MAAFYIDFSRVVQIPNGERCFAMYIPVPMKEATDEVDNISNCICA